MPPYKTSCPILSWCNKKTLPTILRYWDVGHYQLNSPKYELSAQHQLCVLQGKRIMDIDCRWLQQATMWIQSPEYDSIISSVSSCQSHLGGLSAEGHATRGQSTHQRTSRDSTVPIMFLLFPNSWAQQGRVGDPFYSHWICWFVDARLYLEPPFHSQKAPGFELLQEKVNPILEAMKPPHFLVWVWASAGNSVELWWNPE